MTLAVLAVLLAGPCRAQNAPLDALFDGSAARAAAPSTVLQDRKPTEEVPLVGHTSVVHDAAYSPDGSAIVTASWDGTLRLWQPENGKQLREVEVRGSSNGINALAFDPSGQLILFGASDGIARVWDRASNQLTQLPGDPASIDAVAFHWNGRMAATGDTDGHVRLWSDVLVTPAKAGVQAIASDAGSKVYSLAFSPRAAQGPLLLVAGCQDGSIHVWDVGSGVAQPAFKVPAAAASSIYAVGFDPKGAKLIAAGYGHVFVWDVATRRLLRTLDGQPNRINAASFSPDGTKILTAGFDATARIWDAETGAELWKIEAKAGFYAARWSPDGSSIVGSNSGQEARVWKIDYSRQDRAEIQKVLDARVEQAAPDAPTQQRFASPF